MKVGISTKVIVAVTLLILLVLLGSWIRPALQAAGRVEYKVATVPMDPNEVQQILNQHAANGWEFVGTVGAMPPFIVFKK